MAYRPSYVPSKRAAKLSLVSTAALYQGHRLQARQFMSGPCPRMSGLLSRSGQLVRSEATTRPGLDPDCHRDGTF
jgi:hypothetical protein